MTIAAVIAEEGAPTPDHLSARTEPFGYACQRCLRCCHHKHIQVNPYEVARIARRFGVSSTEARRRWTVDAQGTALAQTAAGACVFLGAQGCTIHADRPLVCRLYPLGRHVDFDGSERFSHLQPHPKSAGQLTRGGTIGAYLVDQGAEPFMRAADQYYFWINRVLELAGEASSARASHANADVSAAYRCLDMDAAIAEHCAIHETAEPDDMEERRRLHITILEELFQHHQSGVSE